MNARDSTGTRTTKSTSIRKKSYRSSVFSRSSVIGAFNFCQSLMSPDLLRNSQPHSPSVGCSSPVPPSRPTLAALNSQIKSGEISPYNDFNIREEGDQTYFSRPRSYSDDPFAPPTPRLPYSYSHLSHGDSSSLKSSAASSYARPSDITDPFGNFTMITQISEPCLPNIDRISKFDFSDWSNEWMNPSPLLPPLPVRQVSMSSMSSSRPSLSPTLTCRPQHFRGDDSTQNTPSAQICHFSRVEAHRIPFPDYS